MSFAIPMFDTKRIEEQIAAALVERDRQTADFAERAIRPEEVGHRQGPVHGASLQIWNKIADLAGVPTVTADLVASIPCSLLDDDIFCWNSVKDLDPVKHASIIAAIEYAKSGGFWRTDQCAPAMVKWQLSENGRFELDPHFSLDDPRIMDMHFGLPTIDILARPLMTPIRVNDWPVEFRVFFGCQAAQDGAVSFYYPQAGDFEITPELEAAAEQARAYGTAMYAKRHELGLTPWMPPAEPTDNVGATIDFMLTEERGLVMIDAGPGFGCGAHPCCFIDVPIEGTRWKPAPGVEIR